MKLSNVHRIEKNERSIGQYLWWIFDFSDYGRELNNATIQYICDYFHLLTHPTLLEMKKIHMSKYSNEHDVIGHNTYVWAHIGPHFEQDPLKRWQLRATNN